MTRPSRRVSAKKPKMSNAWRDVACPTCYAPTGSRCVRIGTVALPISTIHARRLDVGVKTRVKALRKSPVH